MVFLPGLAEIESLGECVFDYFGGRSKALQLFDIIYVHSSIMNKDVEKKLEIPNPNRIKLILSTNISESSITVKGVKYIIDFCLTK